MSFATGLWSIVSRHFSEWFVFRSTAFGGNKRMVSIVFYCGIARFALLLHATFYWTKVWINQDTMNIYVNKIFFLSRLIRLTCSNPVQAWSRLLMRFGNGSHAQAAFSALSSLVLSSNMCVAWLLMAYRVFLWNQTHSQQQGVCSCFVFGRQ